MPACRFRRSPGRCEAFLDALAAGQNVRLAAAMAGISRRTVYRWRRDDPDFAARWDDALEADIGLWRNEAMDRALALLGRRDLLRGLDFSRCTGNDRTGAPPNPIQPTDGDPRTDDEIETRIAQLLRKARTGESSALAGDAPQGDEGAGRGRGAAR